MTKSSKLSCNRRQHFEHGGAVGGAQQPGQFANLQRWAFRGTVGRVFAARRLGEIHGGGFGNSHRSKLAIALESDPASLNRTRRLSFCLAMIFSENRSSFWGSCRRLATARQALWA